VRGGVIAEYDVIKCKVGLSRQLIEKLAAMRDGQQEEGGFGASGGGGGDHDVRIICTIVPHELERAWRGADCKAAAAAGGWSGGGGREVEMTCRTQLTQDPRAGLGMTMHHLPLEDDDEPRRQASPPNSAIDQLFECLTTLSSQLESACNEHAAAQSTISTLESKVWSLETLVSSYKHL